ncbi:GntR family transcriptional regulator [Jannaschia sp. CCS1]|uniref:GntR family transcriptional regulator n=1 Tax=Jannaschia sp. (strain CCS1) TaxID=290400 RepID=UPI000053D680|nr:GntR family transcriptional regulator [Jannaschia sp. CCS1]ABD54081.1 transcriptional regulator, GntR family [Jannaschia sp. CCS1]
MNLSTPLSRPSLHEELVTRLRQAIVQGALEPGVKVPERELCENLGVSRTPLREALKVLANEGLVVLESNKGARISKVTMEQLEDAFPVIAVLEGLAGELACKLATDQEIADLVARHDDMFQHYKSGDRPAYFQANRDIHAGLMAAARNEVLTQHYAMLSSRVERARLLANMSDIRWAEAVEEHRSIVKAIEARDGTRLSSLLRTHLNNKLAALRKALS